MGSLLGWVVIACENGFGAIFGAPLATVWQNMAMDCHSFAVGKPWLASWKG